VRGRSLITGALALAAAGVVAVSSRRRRRRNMPERAAGTFPNGMGYVRLGTGTKKTLLWIPDPSHNGDLATSGGAPKSMWLATMGKVFRPFVEDGYTVFLVGHKPDLPHGCTVADLTEDYAGLIVDEFAGKVDLVVADSNGGLIGFCLAARHPDLFGHIATIVAGYTTTEEAKATDLESARLLSAGRKTDAAEAMVTFMYPRIRPPSPQRGPRADRRAHSRLHRRALRGQGPSRHDPRQAAPSRRARVHATVDARLPAACVAAQFADQAGSKQNERFHYSNSCPRASQDGLLWCRTDGDTTFSVLSQWPASTNLPDGSAAIIDCNQ
jgi:pimeloyl-ACP methyl ester carboxylesterase